MIVNVQSRIPSTDLFACSVEISSPSAYFLFRVLPMAASSAALGPITPSSKSFSSLSSDTWYFNRLSAWLIFVFYGCSEWRYVAASGFFFSAMTAWSIVSSKLGDAMFAFSYSISF